MDVTEEIIQFIFLLLFFFQESLVRIMEHKERVRLLALQF